MRAEIIKAAARAIIAMLWVALALFALCQFVLLTATLVLMLGQELSLYLGLVTVFVMLFYNYYKTECKDFK